MEEGECSSSVGTRVDTLGDRQRQTAVETRERIGDLLRRYVKGAFHMHTAGYNPEGRLEATLKLYQQLSYLNLISQPKGEREKYPLEFTTVTDHAEHLGLSEEHLQRCQREGTLTKQDVGLVRSGRAKRQIPPEDPRSLSALGGDGWGLCTPEENAAMAKSAALELRQMIAYCQTLRDRGLSTIAIHPGVEASITKSGALTIQDIDTLQALDVVIASPHASGFDHSPLASSPEELIEIYKQVVERWPILILGHPFIDAKIAGDLVDRLRNGGWRREASLLEKEKIAKQVLEPLTGDLLRLMAKLGVAWEFNIKSPHPPELQEAMIILLKEYQVPISIGIDGHQILQWRELDNDKRLINTLRELGIQVGKDEKGRYKISDTERIKIDSQLAREKAIGLTFFLRLARLLRQLSNYSISPTQVITSSEERLQQAINFRKERLKSV